MTPSPLPLVPSVRPLTRNFFLLFALLLGVSALSIFSFRQLEAADAWKMHTYQVLLTAKDLDTALFVTDNGYRAFIVSGEPGQLADYNRGQRDFRRAAHQTRALVSDRPAQQIHLKKLEQLHGLWIQNLLEPMIAMRRVTPDGRTAVLKNLQTATERRRQLGQIRAIIAQMETIENELLAQRSTSQLSWQKRAELLMWAGSLFSLVLAFWLGLVAVGAVNRAWQANAQLQKANEEISFAKTKLQSSYDQLASEIAQRREAETKLARNLEELHRSNADLEQFAYVASHDLQEPLRAVAGCVQVLKRRYEGQLDARADQFIDHAVDGAQRMQNLINDLLAYSRIGTHSKPFRLASGDEILDGALQNLSAAIAESGVQISRDILPKVWGDDSQIKQIFQNLLSNAIKFRGVTPRIHVGCVQDGENWVFSVRDNGPGIEAQYFERIFVMFQRLHTRAEFSGTGIGLAICKKIVERHGGKIWVESETQKGTTFFFALPANSNEMAP